jgi:membrane protease YdiL (CAAX protease family)
MTSQPLQKDPERLTRAHVVPFAVFMGFLMVLQIVNAAIEWKHPDAPWWRNDPAQFIYPIQTLVTLGLLVYYWRNFTFDWSFKWALAGIVTGVVGIGFWLLPTVLYEKWQMQGPATGILRLLGFAERKDGFDPWIFKDPIACWTSLGFRFFRAVVIVALVEEIFWRGFLMRYISMRKPRRPTARENKWQALLTRVIGDWEGDYWKQPFGRHRWLSYFIVTLLFMAAHAPVDYAGAFIYGSLTYVLCVWSKSLGACVIMHATANFLMGLYIISSGNYGLW